MVKVKRFAGLVVALLFIWLLGFVLNDIGDIEGPDRRAVVNESVDPAL